MQTMQEGQTIKHDVYGLGIVTSSDGERTAVDFDDHGPAAAVLQFCKSAAKNVGDFSGEDDRLGGFRKRLHRLAGLDGFLPAQLPITARALAASDAQLTEGLP